MHTQCRPDERMSKSYRRLLAARILSEANDLKRTPNMLADDLEISLDRLMRLLQGGCETEELLALIDRMGTVYPIDAADLHLIEDDCTNGIRLLRAAVSMASQRTATRLDSQGVTSPYYEYRDTAFSRLSPFRPEWIRPLRLVTDARPDNPEVAFNNGHLLHQYTFYVGSVNFYAQVADGSIGQEMNTGDSTYGTPWWPHSFTARDPERCGYILAVTFGGSARRALRELYLLGPRARRYTLEYRNPPRAVRQLLEHHLDNEMMTRAEFTRICHARNAAINTQALFDEAYHILPTELEELARILAIEPVDLMIPRYGGDEIIITRRSVSAPGFFPDRSSPRYRVWRMARLSRMPQVKGFGIDVLTTDNRLRPCLCSGLHTWIYNYGDSIVSVAWSDGEIESQTELAPHDSMYLQPFIPHAFANLNAQEGRLCVVRVPGSVDLTTQRELSYLSEIDRVFFEDRVWY